MTTMEAAQPTDYPLRFDVAYPARLSRWLIFVKFLLAIPHLVVLAALGIAAAVVQFIAWWAILFTGRFPEGLFKFSVGVYRWQANVNAYTWLLRDEYPPFSMDEGQYPVVFSVDYPEKLSRLLIFVKWLLIIPNLLVLVFVTIAAYLVSIVAFFAILFTGTYPNGLFGFVVGTLRWSARAQAYVNLWTDKYPPFSTRP
jgi:hypothetical protein